MDNDQDTDRIIGALSANVESLTKSLDKLNTLLEQHNTILNDHAVRLTRIEEARQHSTENWKVLLVAIITFLGGLALSWARAAFGL